MDLMDLMAFFEVLSSGKNQLENLLYTGWFRMVSLEWLPSKFPTFYWKISNKCSGGTLKTWTIAPKPEQRMPPLQVVEGQGACCDLVWTAWVFFEAGNQQNDAFGKAYCFQIWITIHFLVRKLRFQGSFFCNALVFNVSCCWCHFVTSKIFIWWRKIQVRWLRLVSFETIPPSRGNKPCFGGKQFGEFLEVELPPFFPLCFDALPSQKLTAKTTEDGWE